MKIFSFEETNQKHLYFSAAFALSLAFAPTAVYAGTNANVAAVQAVQQNGNHKVTGRVVDSTGEPSIPRRTRSSSSRTSVILHRLFLSVARALLMSY